MQTIAATLRKPSLGVRPNHERYLSARPTMKDTVGRQVVAALVLVVVSCGLSTSAQAANPKLTFRVFAHPGHAMDGIVWTGKQFLYVENTANTVWSAPPAGMPVTQFASMPNLTEETRCILSPGSHGFPPGAIFCHSPDNKVYEVSADGSSVKVFVQLPVDPANPVDDGGLTWDDVGHFGYRLLAATGRSGAPTPTGGTVFAIDPGGRVQKIGDYPGPGGADEITMAPAQFGTVGGEALLTVDPGAGGGALLAIDPTGKLTTVATFTDGPNPAAVIPKPTPGTGTPAPGFYVTDDLSGNVYFAPAASFARFAGDLLVGTEIGAHFYVISPKGNHFQVTPFRHNLRGGKYGLEAGIFVG